MKKRRRIEPFLTPCEGLIGKDANQMYNQLWGISSFAKHNPAPTPITLRREDIAILSNYLVAEKNDGERLMLLIAATEDGVEYSAGIPRNKCPLSCQLTVNTTKNETTVRVVDKDIDLYNGTLLDGEWVAGTQEYVVFDAVVAGGYSVRKRSFEERLAFAKSIVQHINTNGWSIRVKDFVPLSKISELNKGIQDGKRGKCDGLVFVNRAAPVTTGRSVHTKKWKPRHMQTLDLMWSDGKFTCVGENGRFVSPGFEVDGSGEENIIYEIQPPAADGQKWSILQTRPDKVNANHISTVRKTLDTIRENIRLEELLRCGK